MEVSTSEVASATDFVLVEITIKTWDEENVQSAENIFRAQEEEETKISMIFEKAHDLEHPVILQDSDTTTQFKLYESSSENEEETKDEVNDLRPGTLAQFKITAGESLKSNMIVDYFGDIGNQIEKNPLALTKQSTLKFKTYHKLSNISNARKSMRNT